jgi:LuxR family maltose regulon positive regulatory protein
MDEASGEKLKNLGFPADAPQTATILSILNRLDLQKDTVLVIDDFHLVKDQKISELLARAVMERPENLHIAILARDLSSFPCAELTAKGICNAIPRETLRFTREEIRDYCAMMGIHLSGRELDAISEYTSGWISLVYLTLMGLKRGIPVGKSCAVEELLEKVLYNAYDENTRRFLLKLSVMDCFTVPQAAYVAQECDCAELLKKLSRENAFIHYDETCQMYKIHHLMLDFLEQGRQITVNFLRATFAQGNGI